MTVGDHRDAVAGQVPASARIEEIADLVEAASQPFAVVNAQGQRLGTLDRAAVIDVLIGREV